MPSPVKSGPVAHGERDEHARQAGVQPGVREHGRAMQADGDQAGQRGLLVQAGERWREPALADELGRHRQPDRDGGASPAAARQRRTRGLRATRGSRQDSAGSRRQLRYRDTRPRRRRSGPISSTSPSSWTTIPPCCASAARAPCGTRQQSDLRQRLRLQGGRPERCCADQPGPRRLGRGRIEQMVCIAAIRSAPEADVQAGSRHPAAVQLKRVHAFAGHGVLDLDLPFAAQGDVATAVDDHPRVAGEPVHDGVGGQPLADTPGVESHAGRAAHHPARSSTSIDRHLAAGAGAAARLARRVRERLRQRRRRHARAGLAIPGALERAQRASDRRARR